MTIFLILNLPLKRLVRAKAATSSISNALKGIKNFIEILFRENISIQFQFLFSLSSAVTRDPKIFSNLFLAFITHTHKHIHKMNPLRYLISHFLSHWSPFKFFSCEFFITHKNVNKHQQGMWLNTHLRKKRNNLKIIYCHPL